MIILNMGIPRSGTVWAFNVFREILEREQLAFRTDSPNTPGDVDAAVTGLDPAENLILHFHDVTPAVLQLAGRPGVYSFFNFRDPRDVVVSQMRLHEATFEEAMEMTVAAFIQFKAAGRIPGLMLIPYIDIVQHPQALIFQMGTRLGLLLQRTAVDDIARQTSAEKHRSLVARLDAAETPAAEATHPPQTDSGGEPVVTVAGIRREIRVDRTHLLTDRHIQSGRTGRWRTELNEQQRQAVCERFAPIVQLLGLPD